MREFEQLKEAPSGLMTKPEDVKEIEEIERELEPEIKEELE